MFELRDFVEYSGQEGSAFLCWSKKDGWYFVVAKPEEELIRGARL